MRNSFLKFLICLLTITSQTFSQFKFISYGSEIFSLGGNARYTSLGNTGSAFANDVSAIFFNPSLLTNLKNSQLQIMHEERFQNILDYDYIGYSLENFGASIIRLAADNNLDTRNALIDVNTGNVVYNILDSNSRIDKNKIKYFSVTDMVLILSYAEKQTENFSYGGNVKIVRKDNAEFYANGIGIDIGASYKHNENLFFGITLQDATTTFIFWNTGTNEAIPPKLKFGSAYIVDIFYGNLTSAADVDIFFENRKSSSQFNLGKTSFDFHLGTEYVFNNVLKFRFGYSEIKSLNFGVGINFNKVDIDYSFSKLNKENNIGNNQRVSLSFSFSE